MKQVIVMSVFDAFDYVMQHYYPAGMEDMVEKSDSYAIISIQDSHTDGFGITFSENKYCKGVLNLMFDDIIRPVEGAVLLTIITTFGYNKLTVNIADFLKYSDFCTIQILG